MHLGLSRTSSKATVFIGFALLAVLSSVIANVLFSGYEPETVVTASYLIAIVLAYISERVSQRLARVRLTWGGVDKRRIAEFGVYVAIWAAALFFSTRNFNESVGLFGGLLRVFVVYMFAAALFEMLNLLKIEVNHED